MNDDLTLLREYVTEIKEDVEQLNRKLDDPPQIQKYATNVRPISPRRTDKSRPLSYLTILTHRL